MEFNYDVVKGIYYQVGRGEGVNPSSSRNWKNKWIFVILFQ